MTFLRHLVSAFLILCLAFTAMAEVDIVDEGAAEIQPIDSIIAPIDSIVDPVDSTVTPIDSIVAPVDSVVIPIDSTVTPIDSIVAPVDSIVTPIDSIVAPTDSAATVPGDSIASPTDSTATSPTDTPTTTPDYVAYLLRESKLSCLFKDTRKLVLTFPNGNSVAYKYDDEETVLPFDEAKNILFIFRHTDEESPVKTETPDDDDPSTDEPPIDEPPIDEPPIDDPSTDDPSAVTNVNADKLQSPSKIIKNGRLVIMHSGRAYSVIGITER